MAIDSDEHSGIAYRLFGLVRPWESREPRQRTIPDSTSLTITSTNFIYDTSGTRLTKVA